MAKFKKTVIALALCGITGTAVASGWPVVDLVVSGLVQAGNSLLYNVSTAVTHSTGTADANAKLALSGQQEAAKLISDGQIETARANKILDVSDKYQLAADPCTTGSVSDTVDAATLNVGISNSRFGGGGGGARATLSGSGAGSVAASIKEIGAGASPSHEVSMARTAKQHAEGSYCTAEESNGAGTRLYCSGEGKLPNADVDPETVFRGAGAAKSGQVTRTFNDDQMTAMHAYLRNFGGGSTLGPALTEKQARSPYGPQYLGLQKELEQLTLLAKEPLADSGARSMPQAATKDLMSTILQQSPGSKDFYNRRAAAAGGYPNGMSWADLIDIDVMRRYGNGDWYVGMSAATPEAVAREMLFVQAQANYIAMEQLKQGEKLGVLMGAILMSQARQEYVPKIAAKRNEMERAGF